MRVAKGSGLTPRKHCNGVTRRLRRQIRPARAVASPSLASNRRGRARRPTSPRLKIHDIASLGRAPQSAAGSTLVQRELYRELTERHLVVLERRDGIHRLPHVLPPGSLGSPSANTSATSSPVVAESAVAAMMAPVWARSAP
jgi:hypothetical protein